MVRDFEEQMETGIKAKAEGTVLTNCGSLSGQSRLHPPPPTRIHTHITSNP